MTTEFLTLDVWNKEDFRIKVNQGEVNARFLQVQFIDKNEPFNLENKQVFFFAKKPDGNLIFNRCNILDENDGTVNLELTSQMSIVDGIMQDCEFDIIATDLARLKVKGLILEIEKCTDFDSATESTSEFTALEEAIAGYERASDAIDAHIADKNNPHEVTVAQIGAAESNHTHSQYITAETDPTVPLWAKAATKPTYSYSEISNTPTIPTTITDLTGTLPISQGGTNATTASTALSNLGGIPTTRTINSKALSSDITLSASDVGAVPNTRTINSKALSSDITLGVTDIGAASYEVKSSTDFNDVKTPGLYSMRISTTNAPTSGSYHSLIVNKSDTGDYIQQIAVKESSYEIYIRYYNGSSWSSWKQFSMDGHSHATSDITSGTLPIARGGTNATSASTALSNLGGVPTTRTINSKALSSDITLSASDVGAMSASDIITADRSATNSSSTISASGYGTLTFELPYPANQMKILGASRCYSWGNTSSDFKGTQYYITVQGVNFPLTSSTNTTVTLRLYNQSNVPLYPAAHISFSYMLKN